MIKLNGRRYYCCDEILCEIMSAISAEFDGYTENSSPWPPCSGILSMNSDSRNQIHAIKRDIEVRITEFYEESGERCVRPDVMLGFLDDLEYPAHETDDYTTYAMSGNETKFFNFLYNVCVVICKDKLSLI